MANSMTAFGRARCISADGSKAVSYTHLDVYKRQIYDNIIYAELNTKSDYCQKCGWDGEIVIKEVNGKLVWTCPQCGNQDQDTMNVARRTCGYIGTQYWNQGRTQAVSYTHLDVYKRQYMSWARDI